MTISIFFICISYKYSNERQQFTIEHLRELQETAIKDRVQLELRGVAKMANGDGFAAILY